MFRKMTEWFSKYWLGLLIFGFVIFLWGVMAFAPFCILEHTSLLKGFPNATGTSHSNPELIGSDFTANSLGDSFGMANALFSALAFVGVVIAIILQMNELNLQRKEMEKMQGVQLLQARLTYLDNDNSIPEVAFLRQFVDAQVKEYIEKNDNRGFHELLEAIEPGLVQIYGSLKSIKGHVTDEKVYLSTLKETGNLQYLLRRYSDQLNSNNKSGDTFKDVESIVNSIHMSVYLLSVSAPALIGTHDPSQMEDFVDVFVRNIIRMSKCISQCAPGTTLLKSELDEMQAEIDEVQGKCFMIHYELKELTQKIKQASK